MSLPDGVILAGGQSRRMGGGDKGLLDLGGKPLLARVAERLAPQVRRMALNANGDPARFARFGLPVIADSVPGHTGPLAGVLAAMDWAAAGGAESVVTVAADTPFFPDNLVDALRAAAVARGSEMVMAHSQGPERKLHRHPTFGLWPVALREDLRRALADGVRKVILWTGRHDCAEAVFVNDRFDPFFNVNTPSDMAAAEEMLAEISV